MPNFTIIFFFKFHQCWCYLRKHRLTLWQRISLELGGAVQRVKPLMNKHEALSVIPLYYIRKQSMVVWTSNYGGRDREISWTPAQSVEPKQWVPGSMKNPSQNTRWDKNRRKTTHGLHTPIHTSYVRIAHTLWYIAYPIETYQYWLRSYLKGT